MYFSNNSISVGLVKPLTGSVNMEEEPLSMAFNLQLLQYIYTQWKTDQAVFELGNFQVLMFATASVKQGAPRREQLCSLRIWHEAFCLILLSFGICQGKKTN